MASRRRTFEDRLGRSRWYRSVPAGARLLALLLATIDPFQGAISLNPRLAATAAATPASAQVRAGQAVYLRECARCHGPIDGEGISAPKLIGAEEAKRLASFQTAAELFTFIRFAMPQDKPASLPEEDYWAVLAFVLARNGFLEGGVALGPETAEGLRLQR